MLVRTLTLGVAAALALAACSKSEPAPPAKPKAGAAAPVTPTAAPKSGEIDEGLKERLARQEAAAKMFETKVLQPPAPKVPEPPAAVKAATPAPSAPVPAPATAATAAPVRAEPPKATAPTVSAPVPIAVQPAPARTELAAAVPAAPSAPAAPRLVSRIDPDFPREASQAGVDSGSVRARMTLDATGQVTRVEIVEANPRRLFDRSVVRALSQWRYNAGAEGRTVEMEVAFRR